VWQTRPGDGRSLTLLKRTGVQVWEAIRTQRPDAAGLIDLEERGLKPGTRAAYRLAGLSEHPPSFYQEIEIDVPSPKPFAFHAAGLVPGTRALRLIFTLSEDERVNVELFDVQGRRMDQRALDTQGAGDYTVDVPLAKHVPSGIFFVRLSHGRSSKTLRMVVTR
jgi:hypothetical protein